MFTTAVRFYQYVCMLHIQLWYAPDTELANLANLKAGYPISGRISSERFSAQNLNVF
jgi:hypothetical protein